MKRRDDQLLQKARDGRLTAAEQARLQRFLQTEAGRREYAVHRLLTEALEMDPEINQPTKREIQAIAAKINAGVQQRQQRQLWLGRGRALAVAAVGLLLIIFVANWFLPTTTVVEPTAIPPTPTLAPSPTPTLAPNMRYVDLDDQSVETLPQLPPGIYTETVGQAADQADFDLVLPTQLSDNLSYVGAMFDPDTGSVSLALRSNLAVDREYPLWILTQAPAVGENRSLAIPNQPFADEEIEVVQHEKTPAAVGEIPALFDAQEHINGRQQWAVINTLSWQVDGQQLTLTLVSRSIVNQSLLERIANDMHLVR
ncbi:MAG: hypothetical protein QNJ45_16135 [Ardenticatenaceae bacterium]|nr:hypothetical protein [Ardenticatenaceae bacterium]